MGRIISILTAILLLGAVPGAQQRETDIKFRLAQSYERGGNHEAAIKIYEELYAKDSSNVVLLDALQREYIQLKRYDTAILLLQRRLAASPGDQAVMAQLGSVYMRASQEEKAIAMWERAIAIGPKQEGTYRLVANTMVENRMFEPAITLYRRGRVAIGNPTVFANDLAYLYIVTLNYSEASREYLTILLQSPAQIKFVQSQMTQISSRPDGLRAAIGVFEQEAIARQRALPLLQMLTWLYMQGKDYDKAFELYKEIDGATNASGREVSAFAEQTFREKGYATASRAFLYIMEKYPKFEKMAGVKFGYARSLEEIAAEQDTLAAAPEEFRVVPDGRPESEAEIMYNSAIAAYRRVIADYPNAEAAAQSLYRLAFLKQERFFDLDGARQMLGQLESQYRMFSAILTTAQLRLGDVFIALNDLDAAVKKFQTIADNTTAGREAREQAQFRLGEIDYFHGNFKDAASRLQNLTKNSTADVANDALGLQIFIQENMKTAEAPLREFAKASLFMRQRKFSEALTVLNEMGRQFPGSPIMTSVLLSMGEALTRMARFTDAVVVYERMLNECPESSELDKTLMKLGQVQENGLRQNMQAIGSYEKLLERFPKSIYVSEARKRIRELRGDSL